MMWIVFLMFPKCPFSGVTIKRIGQQQILDILVTCNMPSLTWPTKVLSMYSLLLNVFNFTVLDLEN